MKKLQTCLLFALLFILSVNLSAQTRESLTTSQIIQKAIDAVGGKEYLQTINTLYCDISTEMEGRKVHWITKEMLPNKGAFQIVYNDRIVFQNFYDGETGYEFVNGEKQKADPREFKDKQYKKNIFNELDFLDPTLWKLELIGQEKVNGEDCYKIKAILANGAQKFLYYSTKTFYLLREDNVLNAEKDTFNTTLFSGYKQFGRLFFYTTIQFGEGRKAQTGKIASVLINERISEKDFQ